MPQPGLRTSMEVLMGQNETQEPHIHPWPGVIALHRSLHLDAQMPWEPLRYLGVLESKKVSGHTCSKEQAAEMGTRAGV